MILFRSKYRTRIEIAKLKATIKLREIEKEKEMYTTYRQSADMCRCIVKRESVMAKIELLDSLLKGKEVNF